MTAIVIYNGPDACQKCAGWKHIANDDDQTAWKHWAELRPPENIAVQLGLVFPIECPRCKGSGKEPSAADVRARLGVAMVQLQGAWNALGRCTDEFEGDPGACGEYRQALDDAILAVLAAWKEQPHE